MEREQVKANRAQIYAQTRTLEQPIRLYLNALFTSRQRLFVKKGSVLHCEVERLDNIQCGERIDFHKDASGQLTWIQTGRGQTQQTPTCRLSSCRRNLTSDEGLRSRAIPRVEGRLLEIYTSIDLDSIYFQCDYTVNFHLIYVQLVSCDINSATATQVRNLGTSLNYTTVTTKGISSRRKSGYRDVSICPMLVNNPAYLPFTLSSSKVQTILFYEYETSWNLEYFKDSENRRDTSSDHFRPISKLGRSKNGP